MPVPCSSHGGLLPLLTLYNCSGLGGIAPGGDHAHHLDKVARQVQPHAAAPLPRVLHSGDVLQWAQGGRWAVLLMAASSRSMPACLPFYF